LAWLFVQEHPPNTKLALFPDAHNGKCGNHGQGVLYLSETELEDELESVPCPERRSVWDHLLKPIFAVWQVAKADGTFGVNGAIVQNHAEQEYSQEQDPAKEELSEQDSVLDRIEIERNVI